MTRFAPAERDIPFVLTTHCAPTERRPFGVRLDYKHLTALRSGPICQVSFRVETLAECWIPARRRDVLTCAN